MARAQLGDQDLRDHGGKLTCDGCELVVVVAVVDSHVVSQVVETPVGVCGDKVGALFRRRSREMQKQYGIYIRQ